LRRFSLYRGDVQAGDDDTALIIKPYHDPAALWIDGRVVSTRNAVAIAAASDDDERLEWPRMQKLTNIADHERSLAEPLPPRKLA
jgi:hypothetical protein